MDVFENILNSRHLSRIVGSQRRSLESLSQDFTTHSHAVGIVGRSEDLASRLQEKWSAADKHVVLLSSDLHEVQQPRSRYTHVGIVDTDHELNELFW